MRRSGGGELPPLNDPMTPRPEKSYCAQGERRPQPTALPNPHTACLSLRVCDVKRQMQERPRPQSAAQKTMWQEGGASKAPPWAQRRIPGLGGRRPPGSAPLKPAWIDVNAGHAWDAAASAARPHRPDGHSGSIRRGNVHTQGREPTGAVCTLHLSVLPSLLFLQPRQPGRPFTQPQPILMFSQMGFPAPHVCLAERERRNVSVEPGRKWAPCAWGGVQERMPTTKRKKN